MNSITWLHLSDFHFRRENSHENSVENYNQDIVLDSLLEDLRTYASQNSLKVDFIVITGDITFSGRKDEYQKAEKFLDKLLRCLNIEKKFVSSSNIMVTI